jgi:hypothetical protein
MSKEEEDCRLIKEVEFVARCILHGANDIRFQPRPMNLGHGRMVIDLGQAICMKCGTSIWITIDVYDTKWDKATAEQVKSNIQRVLAEEMAALPPAEPEPDEEEVLNQQPVTTTPVTPATQPTATLWDGLRL